MLNLRAFELSELSPTAGAMIVIPAFTPSGVAAKMQSQPSEAVGIIYTPLFFVMVRHADTYPYEAFADNLFLEGFGRFGREAAEVAQEETFRANASHDPSPLRYVDPRMDSSRHFRHCSTTVFPSRR